MKLIIFLARDYSSYSEDMTDDCKDFYLLGVVQTCSILKLLQSMQHVLYVVLMFLRRWQHHME
jgi:hypothetical protein